MKPFLLIILSIIVLIGCGDKRSEKHSNLTQAEKEIVLKETKDKIVNNEICVNFADDIKIFRKDLLNKNLDTSWYYFKDYPHQFQILRITTSTSYIQSILKAKGINASFENSSIKNYPIPPIENLPCREVISLWQSEKIHAENLKESLPNEFYKKYTTFDYYFDEVTDWIKITTENIFLFLVSALVIIYAFFLHYALIIQKDKEGLWLFIATPFAAIPLQKVFNFSLQLNINIWQNY